MAGQMAAIHGARCADIHQLSLALSRAEPFQHNEGGKLPHGLHQQHQIRMHALEAFMVARQKKVGKGFVCHGRTIARAQRSVHADACPHGLAEEVALGGRQTSISQDAPNRAFRDAKPARDGRIRHARRAI